MTRTGIALMAVSLLAGLAAALHGVSNIAPLFLFALGATLTTTGATR